jgi:hypothetical protein
MFACSDFYFRLQLPLIIIHITYISLSLRRISAPIHLTSVLGVLGTQETSCILIAGLLERDFFDLFLPKFDKPWVIHLRETCCCSTNLCTWRPNIVYKNRSVRRHQPPWWCLRLETTEALPRSPWSAHAKCQMGSAVVAEGLLVLCCCASPGDKLHTAAWNLPPPWWH